MQCWCPLVGGKRDMRWGKKMWHVCGMLKTDWNGLFWQGMEMGSSLGYTKSFVQGFVDGHQRVITKWDFSRSPEASLPPRTAEVCGMALWGTAKRCWCGCHHRQCAVDCEERNPPQQRGSALATLLLGFWGQAIGLGPAQLWRGCRFAQGVQCPLTLISLDSTAWHREALHFISSQGSPPKQGSTPILFIYVILVHSILCPHFCVPAFQDSFWLWKRESTKCNRKYGSQCISHYFFHKLRARSWFVVKWFVCYHFLKAWPQTVVVHENSQGLHLRCRAFTDWPAVSHSLVS